MLKISSSSVFSNREDLNKVANKAFLDILNISLFNAVAQDWSLPCLGKILCEGLLGFIIREDFKQTLYHYNYNFSASVNASWNTTVSLQISALAHLLLDNHGSDFESYLDHITSEDPDVNINCSKIFQDCFV